jgi:hypothetical protein
MEQLFSLLAVALPDWTIPWAGIGAAAAGIGSLLSGLAAYKIARRGTNDRKPETSDDNS